jgi:hypothetical protein
VRDILSKCRKAEKLTHFAVTCESAEKDRDGKYGFNQVLAKARSFLGDYAGHTAAFSTALVADSDEPQSLDPEKKVHFTEENFRGAITERVADFVAKIGRRETTAAV